MIKHSLLAALAVLATATPAFADLDAMGTGNATVGFQSVGGRGLNLGLEGTIDLGVMDLGARLMAPPGNVIGFFTAEAGATFVGHTRNMLPFPLPVDVQPMMGLAFSFLMQDIPKGSSTTTDLNIDMFMPVGLAVQIPLGVTSLQAKALYHLTAISTGKSDLQHWRFEVGGNLGKLFGAVYLEQGAIYNGPGARVGLAF
jgi:hypothetical protein